MTQNAMLDENLPLPAQAPGETPPVARRSSQGESIRRFLPHSWKDLLAISIAVVSLVISLNTSQKQAERDYRRQLTDTLDRYLQIQAQQINIFQDIQNNPNNLQLREFSRQVYNTFDMQNSALLSQAADLVRRIPDEVEWVDYATLALGYASTGDIVTADEYYRGAIDAAKNNAQNNYAIARARNMYAAFLFTQPNRVEDGRKEYEAINALIHDMAVDEELRLTYLVNNDLYWARSEANLGNLDDADKVLANACETAKTSTLPRNRDGLIAGINETWALVHQYGFGQIVQPGGGVFCQ